jgi:glutathionylspermidine amidase/synthetase
MFPLFLICGVWLLTRPRSDANLLGADPLGTRAYHSVSSKAALPNYHNGVYTGQKYECVEFARRWLVKNRRITFRSIEKAEDLLFLQSATTVDGRAVSVEKVDKPEIGDLVIFPRSDENPYGHVAVVVRVLPNGVHIAEQNHSGIRWRQDYSRELQLPLELRRFLVK